MQWLGHKISGNQVQLLLKYDEDVFIRCAPYFVAPLIDEQEWHFVQRGGGSVGNDLCRTVCSDSGENWSV